MVLPSTGEPDILATSVPELSPAHTSAGLPPGGHPQHVRGR